MPTKPAFIIPDWKLAASDIAYRNIGVALREKNYNIVGQDIAWFSGKLSQWNDRLVESLRAQDQPATVYAFGVSSMIALAASAHKPVKRLILCSPRGYYKEYLPQCTPGDMRWIGDGRLVEFIQLSYMDVLSNMQVEYGSIIIDETEHIGRQAHKQWLDDIVAATGWQVTTLPRQRYGVMSPGYQQALVETARAL
jgi:hypothetical protein